MTETWVTISALATAGGTLVLAVATFASVRSANRAARAAERALLEGLRPVLVSSRLTDPDEKFAYADGHWVRVPGGHGIAELSDQAIYLAMALRNVGRGLAVLHGWTVGPRPVDGASDHQPPDTFRRLTRDLYIPGGDLGFWQGALRDPAEPLFAQVRQLLRDSQALSIELLYGDHEGGQRMITRFSLTPVEAVRDPNPNPLASTPPAGSPSGGPAEPTRWVAAASRHWNLDRADPR